MTYIRIFLFFYFFLVPILVLDTEVVVLTKGEAVLDEPVIGLTSPVVMYLFTLFFKSKYISFWWLSWGKTEMRLSISWNKDFCSLLLF